MWVAVGCHQVCLCTPPLNNNLINGCQKIVRCNTQMRISQLCNAWCCTEMRCSVEDLLIKLRTQGEDQNKSKLNVEKGDERFMRTLSTVGQPSDKGCSLQHFGSQLKGYLSLLIMLAFSSLL